MMAIRHRYALAAIVGVVVGCGTTAPGTVQQSASSTPVHTYNAHVVRVVDGDTIRCDVSLGWGVWLQDQSVRLRGIDAPEMRGDERPAGIASRNALTELLDYRNVTLRTDGDKRGKYGRMIVDVWVGQVNVNDWMVANGHAEIYE